MSGGPTRFPLAAEFPAASAQQWRELVAEVLRRTGRDVGGDPIEQLSSTTYDDLRVLPLYTAADVPNADDWPAAGRLVREAVATSPAGWDVRQRVGDADPAGANAAALAELAGGATSLWLPVGEGAVGVADLVRALDGVLLELAPVTLDAGGQAGSAAHALLDLIESRGLPAEQVGGGLGLDPIAWHARSGAAAELSLLGQLADRAAAYPGLQVATVDATVYHDAGGSDGDELATSAAVGVAYLRALTDHGLSVDAACAALEFRYAVTADQFPSIAKLRAARVVWDRITTLCGASPASRGQRQHAVTSAAMMTRRDPWVNLLRVTIAGFAAAVGGAQAITVAPFDAALGVPDAFARRIARNTQVILQEEASLARVIDPAGGSWYLESFTQALAESAWSTFTEIERAGGALAALDGGLIPARLAESRQARGADIAHRRAPITGVSEFAFPEETPVRRPASPPRPSGSMVPARRYAEDFEQLRDRSDAAPARPRVFLAALGPVAAHGRRVAFARNVFHAGGIEVVVAAADDPDALVSAFRASATPVACLCSSDPAYAESGSAVASALRAAGARHIWLAGRPSGSGAAGREDGADRVDGVDGVDGFDGHIYAGVDALAVLRTTLDQLGVAP
jgi:methylmalonyl-CoA mutase